MGAECYKRDVERVSFRGNLLSPGPTPSGSVPFLGQHLAHDRSGAYALVVRSDTRRQRDANLVGPELVVEQGRVGNRKLRPYSVAFGRHALFENSESLADDFAAMRSNVILQVQSLLRLARRDVAFGGKDARVDLEVLGPKMLPGGEVDDPDLERQ